MSPPDGLRVCRVYEAPEPADGARVLVDEEPLTLLTATKDVPSSHAAVLAEVLQEGS
ncbi:hypothetical protein SAMN06272775_5819 [Streptomyces sp. 2323.1]|uniref:hypothetical protein n=1 Tax=Streptomyces sp. 2323.1 TaxID=1938841 RepID=UPI000BBF52ED|nr:hypothetical protein [Streptomyces sp. 2323.1]SOE14899.1 hypothetical protein SAMN06272775_5819 [Streptomyces sp. 2323.1]